jgi:hypothetical protein
MAKLDIVSLFDCTTLWDDQQDFLSKLKALLAEHSMEISLIPAGASQDEQDLMRSIEDLASNPLLQPFSPFTSLFHQSSGDNTTEDE